MTRAPCLMHWPGGKAHEQINTARELGLDGLLYYGVDEPRTPEQIERCLREAKRRREQGLPMFTAINSRQAQEALGDLVSHPVYVLWVFDGPDNSVVLRARESGSQVISYWTTQTGFPLLYRALTGLYNTRVWLPRHGPLGPTRTTLTNGYTRSRLMPWPIPIPPASRFPHSAGRRCVTVLTTFRYLQALDRAVAAAEGRGGPKATRRRN